MSRFEQTTDGWRDTKTGLEWSSTLGRSTWHKAFTLISPAASENGWRLPTIEELISVIDWSRCNPATELPDTQSNDYWSATTYADLPDFAWNVFFYDGYVSSDDKIYSTYVRAVRGGL